MPYKSEKIKEKYASGCIGMRPLAKEYNVSRSLIRFILQPEKYERSKALFRERRKDGRYTPGKDEANKTAREKRKYKQKLYLEGKIGEEI